MEILKISEEKDLDTMKQNFGKDFVINLDECDNKLKKQVMNCITENTQLIGKMEKINKDEFILKGN